MKHKNTHPAQDPFRKQLVNEQKHLQKQGKNWGHLKWSEAKLSMYATS